MTVWIILFLRTNGLTVRELGLITIELLHTTMNPEQNVDQIVDPVVQPQPMRKKYKIDFFFSGLEDENGFNLFEINTNWTSYFFSFLMYPIATTHIQDTKLLHRLRVANRNNLRNYVIIICLVMTVYSAFFQFVQLYLYAYGTFNTFSTSDSLSKFLSDLNIIVTSIVFSFLCATVVHFISSLLYKFAHIRNFPLFYITYFNYYIYVQCLNSIVCFLQLIFNGIQAGISVYTSNGVRVPMTPRHSLEESEIFHELQEQIDVIMETSLTK